MRKHFNDQDFNGNRLHNVGVPAAAADAANKAYVDGIGIAVYHINWDEHDQVILTDRDGNTVTPQAVADSADAGKAVLLKCGVQCYTLEEYDMSGSPQEMVFVAAYFAAGHGDVAFLAYLYYNSNDGWDIDSVCLQNWLVSGQNIKTVGGQSLLGSGDIALGKDIVRCYSTGVTGNYVGLSMMDTGTDLENGVFLMVSFSHSVPANGGINIAGTVIQNSELFYPAYPTRVAAGQIAAGDTCLIYYSYSGGTNLSTLIFNSRWGADIAGKQDALVAAGANQNIKTINSTSLLGSGNITLLPTHTLHTHTLATAGSTTTVTCAANERAFHIVEVTAANCTLNIDILNGWDNTVYISGNQNINIVFKINGVQATTIFERHDQFAGLTAILTKAGAMKIVVEVIDNKVFVDVDAMDTLIP